MPQGNDDTTVASRRILQGSGLASGDWSAPPAVLREASTEYEDQLTFVAAGSMRWIALDTQQAPFDDLNVRKAVVAGFNRTALLLARGGRAIGDIPTHFIPPGLAGFEEAGGMEGPGLDFMSNPDGDMELAAKYFRDAGMTSGKYEGDDVVYMVGTSEGVAQRVAEVAKENFERLGFTVRLRLVTQDAMYTRFCQVPGADVDACPNVGWGKDFSDPQTMLDPTFNGANIIAQNNSNMSELDVPAVNEAMTEAETVVDPADRATAWANIDRMVTEQAPAVAYQWEKAPLLRSKDVNGVANEFNSAWDPAFTSLR
jgi:peptide/nickel transport system substrate-binding protein